jgi:phosphopentomutase
VIVVLDGLGIGALPDASEYGDSGSHTLDNAARAVGALKLRNLEALGLGLIEGVGSIGKVPAPGASYGRMKEASPGKDTTTGHWEMAGVVLEMPFPTYPEGLPIEMLRAFAEAAGRGWLGGTAASGTEIIERLGEEHLMTGRLIVYTSADSVFQIAAHEDIVPVEELYRVCGAARRVLDGYNMGRVIARPFTGRPGGFKRTKRRRDYSIAPPGETLLDIARGAGLPVVGIGKIGDIFAHRGLSEEAHTDNDMDGIDKTVEALRRLREGLIFTNLVDLDTLYGHRNDPEGYGRALERIDARIPEMAAMLGEGDIFFITADHGCDPTTESTDHSREYVPLMVLGKGIRKGVDLGTRQTMADLGQTVASALGLRGLERGASFLGAIT